MYNGIHNAWDLFCVLARLCSAHLIHSSLFLFIACCLNMMFLMCVYVYAWASVKCVGIIVNQTILSVYFESDQHEHVIK